MSKYLLRKLVRSLRTPSCRQHRRSQLQVLSLEDRTTPSTFTVLTTDDDGGVDPSPSTVLDGSDNGTGTLRQAIVNANANPGPDFIVFGSAFASANTVTLAAVLPSITDALTITGNQESGVNVTAISGGGAVRIFSLTAAAGTPITFDKLILTNGNAGTDTAATTGGAISASTQAVTITNSTLTANTAPQGGAIRITGAGTLTISNSTLSTNSANYSVITGTGGGAVLRATTNTIVNIDNTTISANTSFNGGGAMFLSGSKATITNSLIIGNKALASGSFAGRGGGIFMNGATIFNLSNSRVTGNSAGVLAGGIYCGTNATASVTITNCSVDTNTAGNAGGGLDTFGPGSITIRNSSFFSNSSNATGGAIFTNAAVATILIENSTFTQNTSASGGGAVHFNAQADASSTTIRNSTITRNVSNGTSTTPGAAGGGVVLNKLSTATTSTLNLISTIVSGNTHNVAGGMPDVSVNAASVLVADFSAIGSNVGHTPVLTKSSTPTAGTNLDYGAALALGVLADNGGAAQGPTGNTVVGKTIELLAGSAAINAGSNPVGLTTDQRGGTFAREIPTGSPDIGAFERVPGAPSAIGGPYLTINESNFGAQDPYVFTVKYAGDFNLDVTKLDNKDVRVKNTVTGYDTLATFVSSTPAVNSTSLVATYKISAPAGGWTNATNGSYSISVEPNEVFLFGSSLSVPATTVGTFIVARDYIVTSPNDTGPGTLRQAILDSNLAGGANVIRFDSSFNTTQSISVVGQMTISDSLSIVGPGAKNLTLDGGGFNRIFNITNTTSQLDVTLSGMKLFNCSAAGSGGAVFFGDERLTLNDMFITGNTGSNGGAVGNNATLVDGPTMVINRSALTGNVSANRGGAIMFYSTPASSLDVRNSTISGNSAVGIGGAFYGFNWNSATHKMTISNSTITQNTSNTFGGGIRVSNTAVPVITLHSTIVSGNSAPTGPDFFNGTINSDFSAIGDVNGTTVGTSTNDLAVGTDIMLQPLGDNGGPTPTHGFTGGPLLDAGSNPNGDTFDQRGAGFNRVSNGIADIGAFELQSTSTPVVSGFVVNNGDTQRSRLTTIQVNFASPVDVAQFQTLGAVTLTRTGIPTAGSSVVGTVVNTGNGLIVSPATGTSSSITLTFSNIQNAGVEFGSLADGRWQLAVVPAGYTSPNSPTDTQLRRLFGNQNNDTLVDAGDFGFFPTFGTAVNSPFDFNNDGDINASDLGEFGNRFGITLV